MSMLIVIGFEDLAESLRGGVVVLKAGVVISRNCNAFGLSCDEPHGQASPLKQNQGRCIPKPGSPSRRDPQGAAILKGNQQDIVTLGLP